MCGGQPGGSADDDDDDADDDDNDDGADDDDHIIIVCANIENSLTFDRPTSKDRGIGWGSSAMVCSILYFT